MVMRSCGLAVMRSGIKKYSALGRREKHLFLEAFFEQLWAGFIIKIVPFRWVPKLYAGKTQDSTKGESNVVRELKKAVERAGIVSPWKNRCLVQSLAARTRQRPCL